MRQPRGEIYENQGFFHIESLINPGLPAWTREQAEDYGQLLAEWVVLSDVGLVFWLIHPRGFGLIIRKEPERAYPFNEKLQALRNLGETAFADRWEAQLYEGAKPLARGHVTRREFYRNLSQDVGQFTKCFKQRISRSYNGDRKLVGSLWRGRAKVYHLPDDANDRVEIAAYVLAQAREENGEDCLDWPGTISEVRNGNEDALEGLEQIYQGTVEPTKQLQHLLKHQETIQKKLATHIASNAPGRRAVWRPTCEQGLPY